MRLFVLAALLAALSLAGCRSGPGSDCDTCASAEAKPAPGGASAAAAASASKEINPTAHSGETGFTPTTKTTISRGAGDANSESSDMDTRHTASGGAVDMSVMGNPTKAAAAASAQAGGGVSASVQEARKDLATWRSALALEMAKESPDMAKLDFFRTSLSAARADLNAAEAAAALNRANVTINYNQNGDPTLVNVSSSSTAGRPDPEAVRAAVNKATGDETTAAAAASKPSSDLGAPPAGEAPKKDDE